MLVSMSEGSDMLESSTATNSVEEMGDLFSKIVLQQFKPSQFSEFLAFIRKLCGELEKKTSLEEKKDMQDNFQKEYIFFLEFALKKQGQQLETLQEKIQQVEEKYENVHRMYQAICDARQKVIDEQKKAINAYRLRNIKEWLRIVLRPCLGKFYHYDPRPLDIPKYYETPTLFKKTPPLISIVTPSYNQADFLERTILSVVNQQYPALEYIVQDGGSTDKTVDILRQHEKTLKRWESMKDKGQSNAINLGFQHATGEIMAYLNSDDLLLPGTLHYVAKFFMEHPDIDVVYGHRILIDEYDQEIGRWVLPPHDNEVLSWADYIPQETLFWRRRIWDKVDGKIDESFQFAMDWDLLLRFREAGAKFVRLPRFLGAFRVHIHQKSSAQINQIGMKEMSRLRLKYIGRHVSAKEISQKLRSYMYKHLLYHRLYRLKLLHY